SKPAYQWPLAVVIGLVLFWILAFSGSQPTAKTVVGQIRQADDFNADPDIFETALVAMEAQVDLGNGVVATAQTVNGTIPGPEIRSRPRGSRRSIASMAPSSTKA